MKFAMNEPSWVRYVKEGDLEQAYKIYSHTALSARSFRFLPIRWLSDTFGIWIFRLILKLPLKADDGDTAVDLSTAFLLFWKRPNWFGAILLIQILKFIATRWRLPLRASFWLTHWFCFQGRYGDCQRIFKILEAQLDPTARLFGEASTLRANFEYVIGNIVEASELHERSHRSLVEHKDKFFRVFNLGLWIRCAASFQDVREMQKILSHFDGIDPEVSDKKYGLKLLSYCSLIYFQQGRTDLGERFLSSAQLVYSKSGSQIDRAVFSIVHSIILHNRGDITGARLAIHQASLDLRAYGRYFYYDELIRSMTKFFSGETLTTNELSVLPLEMSKSSTMSMAQDSEESWYQRFFKETLRLYENFSALSFNEVIDVLRRQTTASELSVSEKAKDEDRFFEPEFEFCVLAEDSLSQFKFTLWHQGQEYSINLKTPFLPWRNSGILDAIKSIILSLQSVSYHEANRKAQFEIQRAEELKELSRQVYHDIGSPIATLSMVFHACPEIPKDSREVIQMAIQRVKDITKNLVTQHSISPFNETTEDVLKVQRIVPLIESVIAEKRFQYRSKVGVKISTDWDAESVSFFAAIQSTEFQRALSNLINNAVEALEQGGHVNVRVELDGDDVKTTIEDNGKGIPHQHLIHLGNRKLSFEKPGGSGLGLYHAKKTAARLKGSLSIESKENQGTRVSLKIPRCPTPEWFSNEICVANETEIVVVDDDDSIHRLWRMRFGAQPIRSFKDQSSFEEFLRTCDRAQPRLLLIDHELGVGSTGLSLIQTHDLSREAFLVTSHADDERMHKEAAALSIKLIPKSNIGFVRIRGT
jgi:signal transduction histidine kinase